MPLDVPEVSKPIRKKEKSNVSTSSNLKPKATPSKKAATKAAKSTKGAEPSNASRSSHRSTKHISSHNGHNEEKDDAKYNKEADYVAAEGADDEFSAATTKRLQRNRISAQRYRSKARGQEARLIEERRAAIDRNAELHAQRAVLLD